MSIKIIGKTVRDKAESLLSDPTDGFNATYAASLGLFGLTEAVTIDFTEASTNFFRSQVSQKNVEESSCFSFPFMLLYVKMSYNARRQKFNVFSGDVTLFVEIWHSWSTSSAPKDSEKYMDADESVLVHIFNSVANQGTWDMGTVYNGDVRCERTPLKYGGQSWVQGLMARLDLQTHTG